MAENQPEPTPAVDPGNTGPQPAIPPADPKPADPTNPTGPSGPSAPAITLSDDQKAYLKGQGLTDADLSAPDALTKIISHAQSSQKTAAEIKAQLDKIAKGENPTGPSGPPAPSQPNPDGTQPQLDNDVAALAITTSLSMAYPDLKDKLTSGELYQDMKNLGIPLQVGGQWNIAGIQKFAAMTADNLKLQAQLADKPDPSKIPDANPTLPAQPADDAPMTKQIALAIAAHTAKGGTHPRSAEATKFLQDSIK